MASCAGLAKCDWITANWITCMSTTVENHDDSVLRMLNWHVSKLSLAKLLEEVVRKGLARSKTTIDKQQFLCQRRDNIATNVIYNSAGGRGNLANSSLIWLAKFLENW